MSESKHTPGPWEFNLYGQSEEMLEKMKSVGIDPVRMLDNDGQMSVMCGTGDDQRPVARVCCQTPFKRGKGHMAECAERDANAKLIAAAPTMYDYIKSRADGGDSEAARIIAALID